MLLVVVPVIIMTLYFAWRYRASNEKAVYAPNWAHSTRIEVVVWTIPCIIVVALAALIWKSTHTLDPYRPLDSDIKPLHVEVVALNWKWLFIYPDYGIATVNALAVPVDTPIHFDITADSLMNSLFIPSMGTQVYAMPGMKTQLHLIANSEGHYHGISAAYSGAGFSDMHFDVNAMSAAGFQAWVAASKKSPLTLDGQSYQVLSKPSIKQAVEIFGRVDGAVFDDAVNQYMAMPDHMQMSLSHGASISAATGVANEGPRSEADKKVSVVPASMQGHMAME
jgi:cytochrome o ubiquinol oxidase subunit 2